MTLKLRQHLDGPRRTTEGDGVRGDHGAPEIGTEVVPPALGPSTYQPGDFDTNAPGGTERVSPALLIAPDEIPSAPKTLSRDAISPSGFVSSVQATRIASTAIASDQVDALALHLANAYVERMSDVSWHLTRGRLDEDGHATLSALGEHLVELGPAEIDPDRPGVAVRRIEEGLLVPDDDRGSGRLSVRVAKDGDDLLIEVRLSDFRSAIRGTKPRAGVREFLYRQTQCRVHSAVCKTFLRRFAKPEIDRFLRSAAQS